MSASSTRMRSALRFAAAGLLSISMVASPLATAGSADADASNGRIVYVETNFRTGVSRVFLIDPDGTNRQEVPPFRAEFFQPTWSPDGSEINIDGDGCGFIHPKGCATVIVDPDTGAMRWLPVPQAFATRGEFGCMIWSPDGSSLACEASSRLDPSLAGIYTIRSYDGGDPERVIAYDPTKRWHEFPRPRDFSPDGSELLYVQVAGFHRTGYFLVNLDGTEKQRVSPEGLGLTHDEEATFSPSGDWILFTAYPDGNHRRTIYLVHPDGSGFHEAFPECGGRFSNPDAIACANASWSPDGSKIVYWRSVPSGNGNFVDRLVSENLVGSDIEGIRSSQGWTEPIFPDWGTHALAP